MIKAYLGGFTLYLFCHLKKLKLIHCLKFKTFFFCYIYIYMCVCTYVYANLKINVSYFMCSDFIMLKLFGRRFCPIFLVLWKLLCKNSSEHGVLHLTPQEKFGGIMSGHLGCGPVGSSEPLQLPGILCSNFCTIVAQHLVGSMLLVKIPCFWPIVDFWHVEINVLISLWAVQNEISYHYIT
jgi:hypothetical protein